MKQYRQFNDSPNDSTLSPYNKWMDAVQVHIII